MSEMVVKGYAAMAIGQPLKLFEYTVPHLKEHDVRVSITGSFLSNRATMQEMLGFAKDQGISPQVELMPKSQVNHAFHRLRENKARYRIVLVNDMDGIQHKNSEEAIRIISLVAKGRKK